MLTGEEGALLMVIDLAALVPQPFVSVTDKVPEKPDEVDPKFKINTLVPAPLTVVTPAGTVQL